MKIALVDVDGRNFPNLALMKIAGFWRKHGHAVEWYQPLFSRPDAIFASKVFTFTPDYSDYATDHPSPIRGGTGYGMFERLEAAVEAAEPDYSIYPQFSAAYGFLTRGCIRSCAWCVVPRKEGALRVVGDIERVAAGRREVVLLDNNFLAAPFDFVREQLEKAAQLRLKLDFNQGLDARLMTPAIAALLARCKWIRFIRFSCDTLGMIDPIREAAKMVREAGCRREIFCYMLVQDVAEAETRLRALVALGVTPFAQPYRSYEQGSEVSKEQRAFASFANVKGGKLCLKMKFDEYYH